MNKKDVGFVPQVDFKEQTPDVLLKTEKPDPLYEKAFLSREDKSKTEYLKSVREKRNLSRCTVASHVS